MDEVINRYLLAMDELNLLTATSYHTADSESMVSRIVQVTDDVLSFLINAYRLGIENASIMLGYDLTVDTNDMEEAIYFMIDGKDFRDRIIDHLLNKDLTGLQSLVDSEFHRVYNAAVLDGAKQYTDLGNFGTTKTWKTIGDEKVRDTHVYLEGRTVDVEEPFYTYDGDYAMYPGGFKKAENNVNCRCVIVLSMN